MKSFIRYLKEPIERPRWDIWCANTLFFIVAVELLLKVFQ